MNLVNDPPAAALAAADLPADLLAERRLRICLLHPQGGSQQISSIKQRCADPLGAALESCGAEIVRASDDADVYHIVDREHAFVATSSFDPRRTVVSCHGLLLLVASSGRLGRRPEASRAVDIFREIWGVFSQAAAVVADSESTRRDILRYLSVDPSRIEVVPPGVKSSFAPSATLREVGRHRWRLGSDKVILQVGRAFHQNGEACLEVVAKLRRQGVSATLLRARQPQTRHPDPAAPRPPTGATGVANFVRDVGVLADDELAMLYNAADVLLFPSQYESFGLPPLEAMASGTPVVCSRAGSLAEFAAPAALTCDPEDISRLCEHVAAVLMDDQLAAAMRANGRAHAARFHWDVTAARMMTVYQRVHRAASA